MKVLIKRGDKVLLERECTDEVQNTEYNFNEDSNSSLRSYIVSPNKVQDVAKVEQRKESKKEKKRKEFYKSSFIPSTDNNSKSKKQQPIVDKETTIVENTKGEVVMEEKKDVKIDPQALQSAMANNSLVEETQTPYDNMDQALLGTTVETTTEFKNEINEPADSIDEKARQIIEASEAFNDFNEDEIYGGVQKIKNNKPKNTNIDFSAY